jgi:hypothetical protein
MRYVSTALLIGGAVLLAGCGDPIDTFRSAKAKLSGASASGGGPRMPTVDAKACPDVQGTYSLEAPVSPGGQFDLLSTLLGGGLSHRADNPWRGVVIDGNSASMLTLTFARPGKRDNSTGDPSLPAYIRYALETPQNRPVERDTIKLQAGVHYDCKRGWLVPTGGRDGPWVRRAVGGDLEGHLVERTARVIPLWAETGAGIPYWFDSSTRTARWAFTSSTYGGMAAPNSPPPRTADRIARQEWELTHGAGASAASGDRGDRPYHTHKEIRALVDRDAAVEKIDYDGKRYVVTLRVESRGQVSRTLENLRADSYMLDVQEHDTVEVGTGRSGVRIATISMRIVAPR